LFGDYVQLGYDMSSMDAGALKGQTSAGKSLSVFVKLAAVSVHHDPSLVDGGQVVIRGRVTGGTDEVPIAVETNPFGRIGTLRRTRPRPVL
jgi:hypothetical protein